MTPIMEVRAFQREPQKPMKGMIIMSRKLASIQRIWKIEPIEGADRIELAYVLGWQCVVNKGQFKPMDLPYILRYKNIGNGLISCSRSSFIKT